MLNRDHEAPVLRELFVEELAQVQGGTDPLRKVKDWIREALLTTHACGEETISPC